MADEEKTDWTGIAAIRRNRLADGEVIEGTYEQLVLKLLKVIAADLDVLALAEAERRVLETEPRDAMDSLNYCPTCACRLPWLSKLPDFVCPDSGGEPSGFAICGKCGKRYIIPPTDHLAMNRVCLDCAPPTPEATP